MDTSEFKPERRHFIITTKTTIITWKFDVLAGPDDVVAVSTVHLSGPYLLRVVGGHEVVDDYVHIHLHKCI